MDVRCSWFCALLLGGTVFLSLSACDDASDVGLGVGPDSLRGGTPTTLNVFPALDTTVVPPQTGLELRPTTQSQWRFLVGRVEDPIGGTVEANGYFDVLGRTFVPPRILNAETADSLSAQLRFTTTYLHGDPASAVGVQVLDLEEEADMQAARADTTFGADPNPVTSTTITPTDSLVTIELPQSWISTHLDVLQDTTEAGSSFQDAFHGFKLASSGGNAVVGFPSNTISLRLIHTADSTTVDYRGFKMFTHVDRRSPPSPPEDRIVLQDGVGVDLSMQWDFEENPLDTLKNTPLNRAEIFVPVDTTTLTNTQDSSFVRPLAKGFRIIATRAPGPDTPSCSAVGAGSSPFSDADCALPLQPGAAPGAAYVSTNVAFPIFETSLLQAPVFTTFRVEIAERQSTSVDLRSTIQPGLPSTLPVLVSTSDSDDPGLPRVTLTVTPL